jgi:hypothetical protein
MLVFVAFNIVGLAIHLAIDKGARTRRRVVEVALVWLLLTNGLVGLFAFVGHAFFADEVARSIGWPTGSPFQFEVAMANLGFGTIGVLCIWLRGTFWLATGLGSGLYFLGDAYGHVRDMVVNHNYAPYNAGPIMYTDVAYPVLILSLLFVYWRLGRTAGGA